MKIYNNVLIDSHNLFHRYYNVVKSSVTNTEELFSKTIELFLKGSMQIENKYLLHNGTMWFLFDNHDSKMNMRSLLSDDYKKNRVKESDTFYRFVEFLKNILLVFKDNYKVVYLEELEADDIVKPLLEYLPEYEYSLLYSSDLDWSRCINYKDRKVDWYDSYHKNIVTKEEFKDRFGFYPTPNRITLYKAIKGDKSDCIPPALKYVKNDDVIKIVENFEDVFDLCINTSKIVEVVNKKIMLKVKEHERELRRNWSLVDFIKLESIGANLLDFVYSCKFKPKTLKLFYKNLKLTYQEFDIRFKNEDSSGSVFKKQKIKRKDFAYSTTRPRKRNRNNVQIEKPKETTGNIFQRKRK